MIIELKRPSVLTIPSGTSVSGVLDTGRDSILGIVMPSSWTSADLTFEVSYDNITWVGMVYDETSSQCNSISSPAPSSAHTVSLSGLLPYRYVRLRSGTTSSPVVQGGDRSVVVLLRPLA